MTAESVRESGVEWRESGLEEVVGFWCLAEDLWDNFGKKRVLFGVDVEEGRSTGSPLSSNNITPFNTLEDACKARTALQEREDIGATAIVGIKMVVGMGPDDWEKLKKSGTFYVVVWRRDKDDIALFGSVPEGKPYTNSPIPGTDIQYTDLTGFGSFESAMRIRYEVARQGRGLGRGAYLATFQIAIVEGEL